MTKGFPERCEIDVIGNSGEHVIVIPGSACTPEDWVPLAEQLQCQMIIPRNPFRRGELPWTPNWEGQWRDALEGILTEHNVNMVIAHSHGVKPGLELAAKHDVSLKRLIAIASPTAEAMARVSQDQLPPAPEGTDCDIDRSRMHNTLGPLCQGMDPAEYEAFCERHFKAYGMGLKEMMRREKPGASVPPEQQSRALIHGIKSSVHLLMICGGRDPWHDQERLQRMVKGRDNTTIELLPDGNHFPHVQMPSAVARSIAKKFLAY